MYSGRNIDAGEGSYNKIMTPKDRKETGSLNSPMVRPGLSRSEFQPFSRVSRLLQRLPPSLSLSTLPHPHLRLPLLTTDHPHLRWFPPARVQLSNHMCTVHFFTAILFNSGFDTRAGFFACVPQSGNAAISSSLLSSQWP